MKKAVFILALFLSVSYNAQTDKDVVEKVDEIAEFKGGALEMVKYISKELKYPTSAKDNKVGGKVFIKFIVTKEGIVEKAEILKGVENCVECDNCLLYTSPSPRD